MADNDNERGGKRQREVDPTVSDVMLVARKMWQRKNPYVGSTAQQEDRDFRESFGCGPFVALESWNMLCTLQYLPDGGTMEHMFWALLFKKQYCKTKALRTLCGGDDAKTIRKWVWLFIDALAELESSVVSTCSRATLAVIFC